MRQVCRKLFAIALAVLPRGLSCYLLRIPNLCKLLKVVPDVGKYRHNSTNALALELSDFG